MFCLIRIFGFLDVRLLRKEMRFCNFWDFWMDIVLIVFLLWCKVVLFNVSFVILDVCVLLGFWGIIYV